MRADGHDSNCYAEGHQSDGRHKKGESLLVKAKPKTNFYFFFLPENRKGRADYIVRGPLVRYNESRLAERVYI